MLSQEYKCFLDAFVDEYVTACHKGNVIVKAAQQFFRRYPGLLPGVDVSAPDAFSDLKGEALAEWNLWFNVSARVRRGIHVLTLEQRFKNYIPPCAAKFCGGAPAGSFPRMVERGMRAALPVTITRAYRHLFKEDLEVFCEPLREKQRLLEPQRGLARRDFDNQASGLYISYHLQREAVPVDEHGRPTKQIALRFPKRLYAAIGQHFRGLPAKPYEAVKNPSMTERYEACKFYMQHGCRPGEPVPQYDRRPQVRERAQYVALVTLRTAALRSSQTYQDRRQQDAKIPARAAPRVWPALLCVRRRPIPAQRGPSLCLGVSQMLTQPVCASPSCRFSDDSGASFEKHVGKREYQWILSRLTDWLEHSFREWLS
jgi:hypothetical protein